MADDQREPEPGSQADWEEIRRVTWDVVVVGGGAAGAVVAARASENPHLRVLLIEAGPDYEDPSAVPDDLRNGHRNSLVDHDWALRYQPTASARPTPFPRGRVTGGSTAVNTTIALRGIPADYDHWAALGNPEWSWDRVLPAFNRLERDLDHGDQPHHGDAGPITVRRWQHDELVPTQAAFIDAARSLGHPPCEDVNAPDAYGVGVMAMNKLGRVRISTAVGYLAPARIRDNLTIVADTLAVRVTSKNGRATGVEVQDKNGRRSTVPARLVVVSTGAVHTPGVLVRSGIGDAEELAALGIEPVATMPGVGANLSDHPALLVAMTCTAPELCSPDLPLVQTISRYTSDGSEVPLDVNLELITTVPRRSGQVAFGIAASLEWVEGRGTIRQTSTDPTAAPRIEQAFGTNERDVARNVAALGDALALTTQPALAALIDEVVFPDPARSSPEELAGLARSVSGSGYHPVGTAKMGPANDRSAVVDQYGRCHGLDGLVVADASIMPTVPRANTNLTSIMIGEMVGEWVRTEPARFGL
ncbi:MAG: GMC family oxidoreductase N-terminal domain-containing protein [Actinomycetota bacterium]